MMEGDATKRVSKHSELMQIACPDRAKVAKVNPQLEGRMGRLHELGFVQAKHFDEMAYVGKSRLTHTNDADFLGLDQPNPAVPPPSITTRVLGGSSLKPRA